MATAVNPYLVYQAELRQGIYFVPSDSYGAQLNALVAIYAVTLAIVLLGLILRIRSGHFSMGQIVRTPAGTWLVPHQVNCWLVASAISYILVQPFIWVSRTAGQEGSDLHDIELWRSVAWYPIIGGGWCACWAVAVATLIPRNPSYNPSWRDRILGPVIVTAFYVGCPFLFCGVDFAFNFRANKAFNIGFDGFRKLDALLGAAALGQSVDLAEAVKLGNVVLDEYNYGLALVIQSRNAQAVMIAILILVYSLSVVVMLTNLSRSLARTRSSTSLNLSRWWSRPDTLLFQYRMQVFAFIASLLFAGAFLILDIVVNVSFAQGLNGRINSGNIVEIATLAALWIQATIGGLVNLSLLLKTFMEPDLNPSSFRPKNMSHDSNSPPPPWENLETGSKEGLNGTSTPIAMGLIDFLKT